MAAATKAGAPTPPSPPPPPPVPVSGITPARKSIAPQLTEEPKGQSPEKAFAERQRVAIAKATNAGLKVQDDAAGEDAAPPPKAPKSSPTSKEATPASGSRTEPGSDATEGASGTKTGPAAAGKTSETAEPAREQRYDLTSLRKWAEKNPEEAAEIGAKLFSLPADTRSEWIRLKNRERKLKEGLNAERETTVAAARAEREAAEQAKAAIDGAATKLAPIADLWEAVAEKIAADPQNPQIDFEAADAAFQENAKISIDDYMRLRARRAIGSGPDAVRLRAENARLKRELAGKPSDAIKTKAEDPPTEKEAAGTAESSAKGKPAKEARDWSGELGSKHKLRQIEGWNALLDLEMRKYHDPDMDEYGADPDDIADKILKREIAAMMEGDASDEEKPKPKAKPNGTVKPNGQAKPQAKGGVPPESELRPRMSTPDEDRDEVQMRGGKKLTWSQIQNRAIQRAQMRARGEIE